MTNTYKKLFILKLFAKAIEYSSYDKLAWTKGGLLKA